MTPLRPQSLDATSLRRTVITMADILFWHLLGPLPPYRLQWVHVRPGGISVYRGNWAARRARKSLARIGGDLYRVTRGKLEKFTRRRDGRTVRAPADRLGILRSMAILSHGAMAA